MKKLKLWFSSLFYGLCRPYMAKEVGELVEWELARRHHLTRDVKAFVLHELERRVPVEGTTHALVCHVRDQAKTLEKRLDFLDGYLVVDSRSGRE